MAFFDDLQAALDALRLTLGGDIAAADVPAAVAGLSDENVEAVIRDCTVLVHGAECVRVASAGVVAARSARDAGHEGMAQTRGHRNAVSLIQDLTGTTKADATKQVRLGEALLTATVATPPVPATPDAPVPPIVRAWHAVLSDAYLHRRLSKDQKNAILRGLGEPPVTRKDEDFDAAIVATWALAAEQLIAEAQERTVEELERTGRAVRDLLDPAGAADRFDERFAKRSFRLYIGDDGMKRGTFVFDDEAAAWLQAVIDAALRPRRGGPRFVDADEAAPAEELVQDPRTSDQLSYDLLVDLLRAGSLADADTVFGTRQAGLRVVITGDARDADLDGRPAVALLEDDGTALPAWLASQRACDTGVTTCIVDRNGNPLDVGREQRLFTPKQRIALAIRDGGCAWHGCDRPSSYCEAHHGDMWSTGGRTDIDRGILLCRYHHMQLHHGGWRITRDGKNHFVLHPPPGHGQPVELVPRLARRYAFGDLRPPPTRFRPAA